MNALNVRIEETDTKALFAGKNVHPADATNTKTNMADTTSGQNLSRNNQSDCAEIAIAEYEQMCLSSDHWETNSAGTEDNPEFVVNDDNNTKSRRKKSTGSGFKRKKKRRDSHRPSITSSNASDETKGLKKSAKSSTSGGKKEDDKTAQKQQKKQMKTGEHDSKSQLASTQNSNYIGSVEERPTKEHTKKPNGELRVYSGSKIQLPSLVFTAAGSALDEDLDKGHNLHLLSYNMDGLKDSPPVKFVDSPVDIPGCPGLDKAMERVHSIPDSIDEYYNNGSDSPRTNGENKLLYESSYIEKENGMNNNSYVNKSSDNKQNTESGGGDSDIVSNANYSTSNTNTGDKHANVGGERRGSKSKRSKRKKSVPQCTHALEEPVFPDILKQEPIPKPDIDYLQNASGTSEPVTRKRRSLTENPTVTFYFKVCKKLGVLPLRKVIQQFGRAHMTFKNLTLTSRDMKALCIALQKETFANSLDFTGNFIQAKELGYVITVLNRLHTIFQVSLCNNCLHSQGISDISQFLLTNDFLTRIDISGNKLTDKDAPYVTAILQTNTTLKTLLLNHNEFREEGGILIGQALAENTTLEDIDLSWNHLRRNGAIGIAKGLQQNTALRAVNLAWNGFGFEGSVAIGDMMCTNTTITELDLAYNRIGPAALLEILRGIAGNKTLRILKMGYNPVTASFSSLILLVVQKHRECALENIDLAGVVVDKEFVALLEEIQKDRFFIVNYEVSLPVKKMSREEMREKIGLPTAYNVDPLRMLYLLKEKMRASDFFYKINKDNDDGLQRDELYELFEEAGLPVTTSVIDKIMEFMDTNGDGTIDLGEFLQGDKRIKNMSRKQMKDEQERRTKDGNFNKYSRTFQKPHADPISLALKVDSGPSHHQTRQPNRRMSKHDSDTEDNNHLKIP